MKEEKRAFGRADAPLARLFFGPRERGLSVRCGAWLFWAWERKEEADSSAALRNDKRRGATATAKATATATAKATAKKKQVPFGDDKQERVERTVYISTHDDDAVMDGAPRIIVGVTDRRCMSRDKWVLWR